MYTRRFWFTLLFVCLFAPFAALLVISLTNPLPKPAAGGGGGNPRNATTETAGAPGFTGMSVSTPARANSPLLAAGDGHEVWVVQPLMDGSTPGFQLFTRPANANTWRLATQHTRTFHSSLGLPLALMVQLPQGNQKGSGSPLIVGDLGCVDEFWLDESASRGQLPPAHGIKAATGGPDEVFVLTFGVPLETTTHTYDPLPTSFPTPAKPPAPAPSPATAPTTAAGGSATAPETSTGMNTVSTTATAPTPAGSGGPPRLFNVYWFPPSPTSPATASAPSAVTHPQTKPASTQPLPPAGTWCMLPPLGEPSDRANVPAENALLAMTERDGLLIVFWVDAERRELVARTLAYGDRAAGWSVPIRSALPQDINGTRLLTATLDHAFHLFWPVPTGDSVELRGGWIDLRPGHEAYKLLAKNMLPALPLGTVAQGISVTDDVAIAPAENSLLAVVRTRDNDLKTLLFDARGTLVAGPDNVEPKPPRRDVQIGQNIAMILMALLLTASLWQWRQKPMPLALPKGTVVAPNHLRAGALFIDLVLPYVIVLLIFGMSDGPLGPLYSWMAALARPEDLTHAYDLFIFIGLHLAHVTIGEFFFQRSTGKSLLGLRVMSINGQNAGLGQVLVRNLLRIPELALGLGPLYVLISDRRQRLGDLFAHTVVVANEEEPAAKEKKD